MSYPDLLLQRIETVRSLILYTPKTDLRRPEFAPIAILALKELWDINNENTSHVLRSLRELYHMYTSNQFPLKLSGRLEQVNSTHPPSTSNNPSTSIPVELPGEVELPRGRPVSSNSSYGGGPRPLRRARSSPPHPGFPSTSPSNYHLQASPSLVNPLPLSEPHTSQGFEYGAGFQPPNAHGQDSMPITQGSLHTPYAPYGSTQGAPGPVPGPYLPPQMQQAPSQPHGSLLLSTGLPPGIPGLGSGDTNHNTSHNSSYPLTEQVYARSYANSPESNLTGQAFFAMTQVASTSSLVDYGASGSGVQEQQGPQSDPTRWTRYLQQEELDRLLAIPTTSEATAWEIQIIINYFTSPEHAGAFEIAYHTPWNSTDEKSLHPVWFKLWQMWFLRRRSILFLVRTFGYTITQFWDVLFVLECSMSAPGCSTDEPFELVASGFYDNYIASAHSKRQLRGPLTGEDMIMWLGRTDRGPGWLELLRPFLNRYCRPPMVVHDTLPTLESSSNPTHPTQHMHSNRSAGHSSPGLPLSFLPGTPPRNISISPRQIPRPPSTLSRSSSASISVPGRVSYPSRNRHISGSHLSESVASIPEQPDPFTGWRVSNFVQNTGTIDSQLDLVNKGVEGTLGDFATQLGGGSSSLPPIETILQKVDETLEAGRRLLRQTDDIAVRFVTGPTPDPGTDAASVYDKYVNHLLCRLRNTLPIDYDFALSDAFSSFGQTSYPDSLLHGDKNPVVDRFVQVESEDTGKRDDLALKIARCPPGVKYPQTVDTLAWSYLRGTRERVTTSKFVIQKIQCQRQQNWQNRKNTTDRQNGAFLPFDGVNSSSPLWVANDPTSSASTFSSSTTSSTHPLSLHFTGSVG